MQIIPLKKRIDFLSVSKKGQSIAFGSFVLQKLRTSHDAIRVGFTVSGKVGNAVERNRVKRRFRVIVNLVLPKIAEPGCDYVLIGRKAALNAPFTKMVKDLEKALKMLKK